MTPSGIMNWLTMRSSASWARVISSRLSTGSFGRIEIRSSSDDSQFTMFIARSRLSKLRDVSTPLSAHAEPPTTTNRPLPPPFPPS